MKTAAAPRNALSDPLKGTSLPLVARLHVDLCRCMSAACCRA
ncbi:hypothetical protein QIS99_06490 [Streptomyces sp. B-S-A8]|uniref:Uncharacterized protein n=1 Tax=Streptomyces solicavernae TaxID=3043614 RepID=A0ABT6RN76_9ACTN|nr:hypothetical protein [Streptomyces sp. B-S-A8]MDI3385867.1 hypothetical protein [Streptomyces sp. B-S-A8]